MAGQNFITSKGIMRKWLIGSLLVVGLVVIAFEVSPRPSVLIVRAIFDRGAEKASRKLESHVPASVVTVTLRYDEADPNATLDIHQVPAVAATGPTIVWIHGGGFVSGRRSDITNYAKVLAGEGFTVVNLDYTIAPEAHYPQPIRQVNKALAFLTGNGKRLGIDADRLVLAGDSAGAQIAAQSAAVISNPAYGQLLGVRPGVHPDQLAGVLLYCGIYDISGIGKNGGILGWFVASAGWAYSGKRNWREDAQFQTMSVAAHLTSTFPPAFVSAGNADPLGPQSEELTHALVSAGIPVEALLFPADYEPPLRHEYQFDLDGAAGKLALQRSVEWLRRLRR
jgi:acetyl esterase/lipase